VYTLGVHVIDTGAFLDICCTSFLYFTHFDTRQSV